MALPRADADAGSSLLGTLAAIAFGDPALRRDLERVHAAIDRVGAPPEERARARLVARRLTREQRWATRYRHLRAVVGAWRFAHRWLAVAMGAAVLFHVVLAVRYGGLWILGGHR